MHKVNYEGNPYSFNGDKHFLRLINNEKSCNEIETNEQSDTQEIIQAHHHNSNTKSVIQSQSDYSSLIRSITEEVEYHKEALRTAQSLIFSYQKQNENLKRQNIDCKENLRKATTKLESVERLLSKLCHIENSPSKPSTKRPMTISSKQLFNNNNEAPQTFRINHDHDEQSSQHIDLYQKLQNIFKQQILYQQQIAQLNSKIKLLEKHAYPDMKSIHQNKLKSSTYRPFTCSQTIGEEKMKMCSKIASLYSVQDTPKIKTNKQSQFKQNLQKEFKVFLQSRKVIVKTKVLASKVPIHTNTHTKSMRSISPSNEKKNNTKRSISVSKK